MRNFCRIVWSPILLAGAPVDGVRHTMGHQEIMHENKHTKSSMREKQISSKAPGTAQLAKVIELLEKMLSEHQTLRQETRVAGAAKVQWAKGEVLRIEGLREEEQTKFESAKTAQSLAASKVVSLNTEIGELQADILEVEKEIDEITKTRKEQRADFTVADEDLYTSVAMIRKAVEMLEAKKDSFGASAFVQLRDALPATSRSLMKRHAPTSKLMSFLEAGQPAYSEQHSSTVLQMLRELITKFEDERQKRSLEERNALQEYKLKLMNLSNTKGAYESSLKAKTMTLSEEQTIAANQGTAKENAGQEVKALGEEHKKLTRFSQEQEKYFKDYDALLSRDITAMEAAIKQLSQAKDTSLLQRSPVHSAHSFIQIRTSEAVQERRVHAAQRVLSKSKLPALIQLASELRENPFDQVMKLLKDLIQKLVTEAQEEQTANEYCVAEKARYQGEFDRAADTVKKHKIRKEELETCVATSAEASTEASNEIAAQTQALSDMATMRAGEKAEFDKNLKILEEHVRLVRMAISTVQSIIGDAVPTDIAAPEYSPVAGGTAMPAGPDFSARGEGFGGGIIATLEALLAEKESDSIEMKQDENQAINAYKDVRSSTEVAKAKAEKTKELEERKKANCDKDLSEAVSDVTEAEEDLQGRKQALDDLQASCVKVVSHEERQAAREEEIKALKEALAILKGEA